MERNSELTKTDSEKINPDSPPPAYSDVVHKSSTIDSFTLKAESFISSSALSGKDSPLMDKMVHLEKLCSSMHSMLEFQSSSYFDVRCQLNEINQSIHEGGVRPQNSHIKQQLSAVLGTDNGYLDDEVNSEPLIQPEVNDYDDLGYDRVCNMLEHLLSDAKIAVEKLPVVEEINDREEGLILKSPRTKSNTISIGSPSVKEPSEVTELKIWRQFLRSGIEHERYKMQRRLIRPTLNSGCTLKQSTLDLERLEKQITSPLSDKTLRSQPMMFSMIYWTLCFTLGVLLLDRYLVELASRQVALAMEAILLDSSNDFAHTHISEFGNDVEKQHQCKGVSIRRNSM